MFQRSFFIAMLSSLAIACAGSPARASVITLTFEGVGNVNPVGDFYNGGAGPNYGIHFGPDALGLVDSTAGGSGNTGNDPSGVTNLLFLTGTGAVMDVAAGFDTGFSFYYAANIAGVVTVWSGLDGTGTLLGSIVLAPTPDAYYEWSPVGVSFAGTAHSAIFGGTANFIVFDNITLGAETPGSGSAAPEPATVTMLGMGVASLFGYGWRKRKQG